MKKYPFTILGVTMMLAGLSSCAAEQAGQKAGVDVKAAAAAQAAPAAAAVAGQAAKPTPGANAAPGAAKGPDEAASPLTVPLGYRYEPRGRRDPFVNPIPKPAVAEADGKPLIRPDGLPGVLVSEVKLSGIINSPEQTMKKAMLVVGRNTYFARQGDSLFDGVIKEIRSNEVVFSMVSSRTKEPVNRETVVRTGGSSTTSAGEKK